MYVFENEGDRRHTHIQRQRNRLAIVLFFKLPPGAATSTAEARSPEFHLNIPHGRQGPGHLGHLPLTSGVRYQRARAEAEHLEFELAL